MATDTTFLLDLASEAVPPEDGILSRTIHQDDHLKVVLFGFSAGQELSEHTASVPAVIQIVKGEGTLTLGTDEHEIQAGSFAHMPARLRHAVRARTPMVMLLLMLKSAGADSASGAKSGGPAGA